MKQKVVSIVKMVTFVKPFDALVKLLWPMKKHLMLVLLATSSIVYGKTYYVATNGKDSNNGTSLSTPFATWQRGINAAYPGDTIFVRGGVYYLVGVDVGVEVNPQRWPVGQGRTGTKEKPICFWAYPPDYESGNYPILDCAQIYDTYETNFSCFSINAVEYWHIKGITIRNAYQRGVASRRPQGFGATFSANLKFENCTAHNISARGFYYFSGAWNTWDAEYANPANPQYAMWDSDTTYFINCDAYDIRDSVNCSAGDGWKCNNYFGNVLIFEGCRAWDYSDDGFDPSGCGRRIFRNCWAMSTNKYASLCGGNIEGNGFKTSAVGVEQDGHYPQGYSFVEVTNCIAAHCAGYGFTNNLELGRDNNAKYFNNTSYHNEIGFFDLRLHTESRGIEMRNNIAYMGSHSTFSQVGIYMPSVYAESHNTWVANQLVNDWIGWEVNKNYNITDADFISLDASQLKHPRKPDGSLPDITFLKLAAGSDLIDAGIDVGLPFSGSAPDLGYAEYGSVPPTPAVPTFVSAAIQNASPDKLEMTYSLSLAAIVPANSAFIVKVNGQTRTVNAVTVAGNKVTLKLASPVAFGQEVTVAYNKPATNPLQTPQGGQVATMTARNVTNNVAAAIPTFNSAVIQNASPDKLEMTYSLSLAAIVPANSAFIVKVNGQTRTVNAVTVAGNKVTLKLASPVAFGQEVTVAYNKPATNPLQTPQGGQVATMTARNVTNNVAAAIPTFNSAVIQNASPDKLEMTYSLSLAAIVPANSAFIVKVNGQTRTVNAVTVAGNKVTLKLASPVAFGQEVTVAYNKPATNPLQTPQGGQVATMTARNVTNNVAAAIPTFNSAVIQNASPDKLEMTYSLSLAAIVPANSAFIVKVNGQTRTVNAVTVAGNKVTLKLASPVAFGQEVTVAYNKPATNPLQTPQGGQAQTMTARNVTNNVAERPNQPPHVSISSPTKNTGYIAPATITIEVNATDSDGTITKVEFYNGQVKLGEVTKAPYLFKWNSVPEGGYQITAVATDNKNAKTVSSPVTVVVNKPASKINQPPFVRITNPDKGETFKRNESIILKAEALDPDGTISKIEFRIGNEVVAELNEAPWVFNWQNADTGQYVITVIATDNLGAVSQSAEVAFTVYEDKIPGLTMLNLYPNPNNGHFTVEMAKEIDSERLYTVFSLSGKVLHNENREGHEVITEFNLIELPSGTYILTVSSDNKIIESRKFIKR